MTFTAKAIIFRDDIKDEEIGSGDVMVARMEI